jgi:hypothetical protein
MVSASLAREEYHSTPSVWLLISGQAGMTIQ